MGIIGFGKMGEAIAKGLIEKGVDLITYDIAPDRRMEADSLGVKVASSNLEVVERSDVIFIAVKPQVFADVAVSLKGRVASGKIVVSIMAGVRSAKVKELLDIPRVVRVMPNTPALVGEGVMAVCWCGDFSTEEKKTVGDMLSTLGVVVEVHERYMDAVTALSGSGPAYVFLFLEALTDAGVKVGLPRDVALKLAFQTIKGSVRLFELNGGIPRVFIDMVTSPGGTTVEALHVLERAGFKGIVMDAVEAAKRRSEELGG